VSPRILLTHHVPDTVEPERFRTYVQKHFSNIHPSNKSLKKAIGKGLFLLNGVTATTGNYVRPGDLIQLLEQANENENGPAGNLDIVYQDDHCLIIRKPAGIPVHSHGRQNIIGLLPPYSAPESIPDRLPHPMPVHRLDGPTGGLLLVARTRSFQAAMGQLFQERKVSKRYIALVLGKLDGQGEFSDPVEGKAALSRYESTGQFVHPKLGMLTRVKLYPVTGRTHQLRIHCAQAGHPILGERKYFAGEKNNLKGRGLFLYADQLIFKHPISGQQILVETDLPGKFRKFLTHLDPGQLP
jgi:RluA family pseudouridine synthase